MSAIRYNGKNVKTPWNRERLAAYTGSFARCSSGPTGQRSHLERQKKLALVIGLLERMEAHHRVFSLMGFQAFSLWDSWPNSASQILLMFITNPFLLDLATLPNYCRKMLRTNTVTVLPPVSVR